MQKRNLHTASIKDMRILTYTHRCGSTSQLLLILFPTIGNSVLVYFIRISGQILAKQKNTKNIANFNSDDDLSICIFGHKNQDVTDLLFFHFIMF